MEFKYNRAMKMAIFEASYFIHGEKKSIFGCFQFIAQMKIYFSIKTDSYFYIVKNIIKI